MMKSQATSSLRRLLALGCAVVLVLGLAACDLEDLVSAKYEGTRTETAAFSVPGVPVLDVESSNGAVVVRSVPGQTDVQVTATVRSRGTSQTEANERAAAVVLRLEQQGGKILLAYRGSEQTDDVRRYTGVAFDVTMPPMATLGVQTSNGAISVSALQGRFQLATSNGAVELADLVGQAVVQTSNGKITVERCQGVLELDTSNGEIRLVDVSAALDAATSNGAVLFSGTPIGDANRLTTSNGKIEVLVPLTTSVEFSAVTSSGSITSSLPLVGDTQGKEWRATLNPPETAKLSLRTSNGAIRIDARP